MPRRTSDPGHVWNEFTPEKIGVVSGADLTFESAVTKLMFLLGQKYHNQKIIQLLQTSLRGELSTGISKN